MSLEELQQKINNRTAHLAVIGLGYVGLPVAAMFADAGFNVLGVELKKERVTQINAGRNPIEGEEPDLVDLIQRTTASGKFRATCEYAALCNSDVILIDVETPVNELHLPEYNALRSALKELGHVMKEGALVIVESTIAPGTMSKLVCPLLEQSSGKHNQQGFYLGNCPERVMPGKLLSNLRNMNRVVGGFTPEVSRVMISLYRTIVQADLDAADWITAELVKTVENSYRDVQIAFANEVAMICEAVGGDVWKVRELVNKTPERNMHLPGAGVGGHCIPKDPWLLVSAVKDAHLNVTLIPAARSINDGMPAHMLELIQKGLEQKKYSLSKVTVLILGFTYLANSDDTRNTPSAELVNLLQAAGAQVRIHDPYIAEYAGDVYEMARGCHAVVLMTAHDFYQGIDLGKLKSCMTLPLLVDGRNLFEKNKAFSAGWSYIKVGDGAKDS